MAAHKMVYCHGWSSGPAVWQHIATTDMAYPAFRDVTAPDQFLPALHSSIPDSPHYVIGWSLGGMLALEYAASQPEHLKGLVLIGTSPKFTNRDRKKGWPKSIVQQMMTRLAVEQDKTLRDFQIGMFSAGERAAFKSYRNAFSANTSLDFNSPALEAGLAYLVKVDLSSKLSRISCPTLWIHGSDDTICPLNCLDEVPSNHHVSIINGAGHVPHWSRPDEVTNLIEEFLDGT